MFAWPSLKTALTAHRACMVHRVNAARLANVACPGNPVPSVPRGRPVCPASPASQARRGRQGPQARPVGMDRSDRWGQWVRPASPAPWAWLATAARRAKPVRPARACPVRQGQRACRASRANAAIAACRASRDRSGRRAMRGLDGKDGSDGKLPIVRLWQPDVVHYGGTVVAFDGAMFQALTDTGRAPDTPDWICLATSGRDGRDGTDGADGRSLRVRGTYKAGETYAALDVVALNGGSFIARRDDPGECPGDGWQTVAMVGKKGPQGPQGERGERGANGAPGKAAPEIVGWDVDQETLELRAVFSDQMRSSPLDLRPLFAQYLIEQFRDGRGS